MNPLKCVLSTYYSENLRKYVFHRFGYSHYDKHHAEWYIYSLRAITKRNISRSKWILRNICSIEYNHNLGYLNGRILRIILLRDRYTWLGLCCKYGDQYFASVWSRCIIYHRIVYSE